MSKNKKAIEFKNNGNTAFQNQKYQESIDWYTKAIKLDTSDATFFSNRCAAYAALNNFSKALEDAEMSIKVNPNWAKGYYRKGSVLLSMNKPEEAKKFYRMASKKRQITLIY